MAWKAKETIKRAAYDNASTAPQAPSHLSSKTTGDFFCAMRLNIQKGICRIEEIKSLNSKEVKEKKAKMSIKTMRAYPYITRELNAMAPKIPNLISKIMMTVLSSKSFPCSHAYNIRRPFLRARLLRSRGRPGRGPGSVAQAVRDGVRGGSR